jgi:hypothetical protein
MAFSRSFSKLSNRQLPVRARPCPEGKPLRPGATPLREPFRKIPTPKAPKSRRTIQVPPGRPAPRTLDFQRMANALIARRLTLDRRPKRSFKGQTFRFSEACQHVEAYARRVGGRHLVDAGDSVNSIVLKPSQLLGIESGKRSAGLAAHLWGWSCLPRALQLYSPPPKVAIPLPRKSLHAGCARVELPPPTIRLYGRGEKEPLCH